MKLDFDVTAAEYAVIRDILERLLPAESTVWVFGSRAKGTARFNSDLDLAIEGSAALSKAQLSRLKADFDDAPLTFRVDVIDLAQIDASFRKIIEGHRVSFPMQRAQKRKLRFPEFTGDWEEKSLHELGVEISDGNYGELYPAADQFITSGVPFIRANNLRNATVRWDDMRFITSELHSLLTSGHLRTDDILITTRGEIGLVSMVPKEFSGANINAQLCLLRSPKGIDQRFLFASLLHPSATKQFIELTTGSALKQLPRKNLKQLKLTFPTLPEQKKIASFLSVVDAKIAALRVQVSGLETYKRGLMQALFSQRLRFTKQGGTAFPDWEEKKLGDLGKFIGGGTPDTENLNFWNGTIPWVSSSDIREQDLTGPLISRWINADAIEKSATKLVPANSILIITRVGVGKLTITPLDVCTSQDFTNFKPSKDNVQFLAYWLLNNANALLRLIQGTSIKGLTSEDLRSLTLRLPHLDEQQKIADALSALDAKIQAVSTQVAHMEAFKKGLLQQMFV